MTEPHRSFHTASCSTAPAGSGVAMTRNWLRSPRSSSASVATRGGAEGTEWSRGEGSQAAGGQGGG